MRKILREKHGILEYGCSAHQMNLVAKELVKSNLITKTVDIAKPFRNCHLPSSLIADEGCKKPPMPSNVCWNSVCNLLRWFMEEWQKLRKVIESHADYYGRGPAKTIGHVEVSNGVQERRR